MKIGHFLKHTQRNRRKKTTTIILLVCWLQGQKLIFLYYVPGDVRLCHHVPKILNNKFHNYEFGLDAQSEEIEDFRHIQNSRQKASL